MATRLSLQTLLESILGSTNVYYQPPTSLAMQYPAIVYSRNTIDNTFADDSVFAQNKSYEVTVIDEDPDSEIVDKVSLLPRCKFDRHFEYENLYHDVFVLYY